MIEIKEIKDGNEWIIAIDKKTSIDYYTIPEAKEIQRQLNELFP